MISWVPFCLIFLLLNHQSGNCCFSRSALPVSSRWSDVGPNGWNQLSMQNGQFSKVMVALGSAVLAPKVRQVEVFDLSEEGLVCQNLPNFPQGTLSAVGGLLSSYSKPVICGQVPLSLDYVQAECFTYLSGHHKWHRSVLEASGHFNSPNDDSSLTAATIYQNERQEESGGLLLISGSRGVGQGGNTMELITFSHGQFSVSHLEPSMPQVAAHHCAVTLNSSSVLVTGGINHMGIQLKSVYFYHTDRQEWVMGPELATARAKHSCALARNPISGDTVVVVAGGQGELKQLLASVELLSQGSDTWTAAADLTTPTELADMVTHPDGQVILIGGRSEESFFEGRWYKLTFDETSIGSHWQLLPQTLSVPRFGHVAFKLPDQLVSCYKVANNESTTRF